MPSGGLAGKILFQESVYVRICRGSYFKDELPVEKSQERMFSTLKYMLMANDC